MSHRDPDATAKAVRERIKTSSVERQRDAFRWYLVGSELEALRKENARLHAENKHLRAALEDWWKQAPKGKLTPPADP